MARTNAQNQAAYRTRHTKGEGGTASRLDVLIADSAKLALKRLAARYGVSNRAMLETLILDAQKALTDTLDSDQHSAYCDSVK